MKKTTPCHIIIKLLKTRDKEKIFKAARGEEDTACTKIRITDFSLETICEKQYLQSTERKYYCLLGFLHPLKIAFKTEGKIQIFSGTHALKEFIAFRHKKC